MNEQGMAMVEVTRGPLVESTHRAHVAVVNGQGKLLFSAGDPARVTYARSAAKPFQAVPIVTTGAYKRFGFEEADLALCCASHNGEPDHADRVASLLKKIGCRPEDLVCGAHPPLHGESRDALQARGTMYSAIHNNCSGKHTGMLAVARALGVSTEGYDRPNHPVQQHILRVISEVSGISQDQVVLGTDGCGVVVFGVPLMYLALSFSRLAKPQELSDETAAALSQIGQAMMHYPFLVAGTGRMCTAFMKAMQGEAVSKGGAEGVYGIGLVEQGIGIAVKVEDGADRAAAIAAVEVIKALGYWSAEKQQAFEQYFSTEIRNVRGDTVGELRGRVALVRHD